MTVNPLVTVEVDPDGEDGAQKWFTAIFLKAKKVFDAVTDESNAITIEDPFKLFTTRNNREEKGFSYNVTIHEPDTDGTAPDPDNV
ncbi:MAG: hypothetical protein AAGG02_18340 [Cyanobacteria bacterium P01_H01_bin.15]